MKGKLRSYLLLFFALVMVVGTAAVLPAPQAQASGFQEKVKFRGVTLNDGMISGTLSNVTQQAVEATLIAALYNGSGELDDFASQPVSLTAGGAQPFQAQFAKPIDPAAHTIKLLVWDSLEGEVPLSNALEVSPYGLKETAANAINPYAFYVGRVARSVAPGNEDAAYTADLSKYIDETNKTITSVTNQIRWNYGQGLLKVNTPKSQGATGKLADAGTIDFDNVAITSNNSFGTVIVISLDGKPIADSKRLLIQAMTEDRSYGYKEKPELDASGKPTGYMIIENMGVGPMTVKNVDTSVLLKNIGDVTKAYALDPNGYVKEELSGAGGQDGYRLTLKPDAIYTVVERAGLEDPYVPGNPVQNDNVYVWWEGENTVEDNFLRKTDFSADTLPDTRDRLSGSDWLTESSGTVGLDRHAKYEVDVPEDGDYSFYARKFWLHGPFYWRFDNEEWKYLGRDITLLDDTFLRQFIGANWVSMGGVHLTKGKHTFELRLDDQQPAVAGLDAFVLTKQPFMPRGLLRPGEKLNRAEAGFWPFEPDTDSFSASAQLDLRYLNEQVAGQNGFVTRQRDKLYLGSGEEARFWALNVGAGVTNLEKGDVDYFARMLAKRGVNMVRIHGMIFDENGNINPKALDKYHYFVSAMKKQGIYVNLSYYFVLWWDMQKAQPYNQPGYQFFDFNKNPFGLLLFDKTQQDLYKKGVKALLTAPNPYEDGLPLAQDPAVANIEIQNEDSYLFWTFADWRFPEKVKEKLYATFGEWLIGKYGSIDEAYKAWGTLGKAWADVPERHVMEVEGIANVPWATGNDGDSKRRRDSLQWMVESQRQFYDDIATFLHDDIGTQSLLTASNWITADPKKLEALERYTYLPADVTDRHAYFGGDHKTDTSWTVKAGDKYKPLAGVTVPDANPVKMIHTDDRPSMISEISFQNPTPYGAEGPFMLSTYASLQGIDSLFIFASGGPGWSSTWSDKWPTMVPTELGQFPALALMYRRGDVAEAKNVVLENQNVDTLYKLQGSKIYESLNLDDARK